MRKTRASQRPWRVFADEPPSNQDRASKETPMSTNGTNGHDGANGKGHADWNTNPRWAGIARPYSFADVLRLRGSIQIEHTLARLGAERLWNRMQTEPYVPALGALTGNQAIEMVQAGLKDLYPRVPHAAAAATPSAPAPSPPHP